MVDEIVENTSLVIFQGKQFRRLWYNNGWYYSVIDIIAFLTDQEDFQTARKYWNKLSQRLREEGSEVVTNCHQLKLPAPDGKLRETDCANTKSLFRIIQSVPSKKAESLKLWLAQVGYDREDAEKRIGKSIISDENYLYLSQKKKKQMENLEPETAH